MTGSVGFQGFPSFVFGFLDLDLFWSVVQIGFHEVGKHLVEVPLGLTW